MSSRAFDVYLNRKHIDTVFYNASHHATDTKAEAEADVKRSLVGHDGYDPSITVKRVPMRKEDR